MIFLAGYLSDFRPLLVSASMRLGPLRLPPVPYLLPMLAMWAMALGIVVIQRDLGAALLFFAVFLALVYIATARASYVVLGLVLFVVGSLIAYQLFGTVRDRVDIWVNPFVDASGKGYQVVQSLYAFGRGGILGTGLGAGLPLVAGRLPIPGDPHRLPAGGPGRGARPAGGRGDPRPVPGRDRARPAGGRLGGRRLPGTAGRGADPGRRRPGVHHRGGQPEADSADRGDSAVHQLRRLVAAGQRRRGRPAAGPLRPGRRAAPAAPAGPAAAGRRSGRSTGRGGR